MLRAMPRTLQVRLALAAGVVAVVVLTLALNNCWCDQQRWLTRVALVSLVGMSFAVELIWGLPRWAFALSVAAPVGWLIFTNNGSVATLFLLVMVGWIAFTGRRHDGQLAAAFAVVAVLGYVRYDSPDRWLPWIAGITATWLMTRMFVVQQGLVQQLRSAQADLERNAVAAERRRIAGEIHDVAAHALALTVLHLTGVRMRVQRQGGDPALVESIAEAERLGRQSLDDVRRTVGLLRDEPSGTGPPLPGASDIAPLVEEYRARGLETDLDLLGDPATVPPATGLAVYRPGVACKRCQACAGGWRMSPVAVGSRSAADHPQPAHDSRALRFGHRAWIGWHARASGTGGRLAAGGAGWGLLDSGVLYSG